MKKQSLMDQVIPVGTRSVLFGAHCWFIHPWFVAAAWTKLYGFPRDWRLWVAFFVHDLGYVGKPNMDGDEGEKHVWFGANLMHKWFDSGEEKLGHWVVDECSSGEMVRVRWSIADERGHLYVSHYPSTRWGRNVVERQVEEWNEEGRTPASFHHYDVTLYEEDTTWRDFCLYHSRFYAKRDGKPFSRLCVADKLSVALEPWWFYLPRVWLSGELWEYIALAGGKNNSKYAGEPNSKYVSMQLETGTVRGWHRAMTSYLREWVEAHCDGKEDTWTPAKETKNQRRVLEVGDTQP